MQGNLPNIKEIKSEYSIYLTPDPEEEKKSKIISQKEVTSEDNQCNWNDEWDENLKKSNDMPFNDTKLFKTKWNKDFRSILEPMKAPRLKRNIHLLMKFPLLCH